MFKFIILIIITYLAYSCTNKARFTGEFEPYISDLDINSQFDETDPIIVDDYLYITAKYDVDGRKNMQILRTKMINGQCSKIEILDNFYGNLIPCCTPFVYKNRSTGLEEYYFSAKQCIDCDYDLYYTFAVDSFFAPPIPVDIELNTVYDEIQPRLSKDGSKLIFVSNRGDSFGGNDIYISEKNSKGIWQKAVNLGAKVNSKDEELYPNFGNNDEVFFSSNKNSKKKQFDIYKSEYDYINGRTLRVDKLPKTINSAYNEKSYSISNNGTVYFASDLNGNFDIYNEYRCQNAKVSFNLINDNNTIINGRILVLNENNEEIIDELVNTDYLEYDLMQDERYLIEFSSDCNPNFNFKRELDIPCSEIKNLEYNFDIIVPEIQTTYSLESYNIPFFVTGYYYPNTTEQLNNLKLKFKMNRFSSDSTNYVEEPGEKYEKYALEIDKAFSDLSTFLNDKLTTYSSSCNYQDEYIKVTVIGYADFRVISNGMKYFGPSIIDNSVDLQIQNGESFNNMQLSKLRAYHTANEIKTRLRKNPLFSQFEDRFVWLVKGEGENIKNTQNLDLSRRVLIKIETLENENN